MSDLRISGEVSDQLGLKFSEIGGERGGRVAAGEAFAVPAWADSVQAGLAHQALDPFAAGRGALAFQHGVHARGAVDAPGVGVDLPDPLGQLQVPSVPLARLLPGAAPAVVGGGGDVQFPEYGLGPEAVLVLVDELQNRRRVGSSSWAKKADLDRPAIGGGGRSR